MSMLIMSCYTGFVNVRRGWQSLNTGPRFYLRLIRRTGWLWISTSTTTDGRPFKPKKLSVPFLYPWVPAGLTPFRGLVPLGRRNLVPILPPAHPLWGGFRNVRSFCFCWWLNWDWLKSNLIVDLLLFEFWFSLIFISLVKSLIWFTHLITLPSFTEKHLPIIQIQIINWIKHG